MKRFQKIAALCLAFMLIALSVGTVNAEAATTGPKLNTKTRTIFVNGSKAFAASSAYAKGTYTLKVTNRPAKYYITWESSDESVATVEKDKYKGMVTAVAPGTATITATVVDRTVKPNTSVTLKCKVTVKANCAAVDISGAPTDVMEPGDTVSLTGTMYTASAKVAQPKVDVTDVLKWKSSNTEVATVNANGLVTAVGEGSAEITCYAVQNATGKYSVYEKAIAETSVTVNVKKADILGIVAVQQKTLNSVEVSFATDYSGKVSADNLKLATSAAEAKIKSITFDNQGTTALVAVEGELLTGANYTVTMTGTDATVGTSFDFTAAKKTPASMTLYTDVQDVLVIANTYSYIYFKLYDAAGVDITPLSRTSTEYQTYASYITCRAAEVVPTSLYSIYDRSIWIHEPDKSVTVVGTYNDHKGTNFNTVFTARSVSEASTVKFAGATISNKSVAASELNWAAPVLRVSKSDAGEGYKLYAKVQKADGTFVYSSDPGSKITFDYVNDPTSMWITSDGSVNPFVEGRDSIYIKYDGVIIGNINVEVGAERIPVRMKLYVDGVESNSAIFSDAFVTNPKLTVALVDNYNEPYKILDASKVTVTWLGGNDTLAYPKSAANSDGTVDISFYLFGMGETNGKSYVFSLKYTDGTVVINNTFTALVYQPVSAMPSTYKLITSGKTDMVVANNGDEKQDIFFSLVEMKGNVRNREISIQPAASCPVDGYYAIVKTPDNKDIDAAALGYESTSNMFSSFDTLVLHTVTNNGSSISKLPTGKYSITIYKKGSTSDTFVAGVPVTLTDSQSGAVATMVTNETSVAISEATGDAIKNLVFSECFRVTIDGKAAVAVNVTKFTAMNGGMYIETAEAVGQTTLNGKVYQITYPMEIKKLIRSKATY